MAKKNKKSPSINRKDVLNGIEKGKIKVHNLNMGEIIICISLFIISVSILTPWFSLGYNNITYGAFSKIVGIIGYISFLVIIITYLTIFSSFIKQKIKLFFNNFLEDSLIFMSFSILLLILGIHSVISLKGLELFSSEITFHSGIIFYIVGCILFVLGSLINKNLEKSTKNMFLTSNSNHSSHNNAKKQKNTTKLPF